MTLGLLTEYDSHVWWFWRLQEQSLPPHTQSVSVQTLVTMSALDTNIRVFMGNSSLHYEVADVTERGGWSVVMRTLKRQEVGQVLGPLQCSRL